MDINALIMERKIKFAETRTKIELDVNKFLESVKTIEHRVGPVPKGYTCQDWLPELWSEDFNKEVYNSQLLQLNQYIDKIRAFCDEQNAEALRCLRS